MFQIAVPKILEYPKARHSSGILIILQFLLVLFLIFPLHVAAQDDVDYDEISVFFNVQKVGGIDLPAVIRDETVYLPVVDIFNFLKIKNYSSTQLDSISGFFILENANYLVDRINKKIVYKDKTYDLKSDDLVKTQTGLYLRSPLFDQIFGLKCAFSFRSLSVGMTTELELPVIRELRQAQMRENLNKLKGEVKADTTIGRKYPALHFGMADWSVVSTQILKGETSTQLNLALGTVIAGGEANAYLNYDSSTPFTEKQQQYLWRFVNNDRTYLRQISAGKISTPIISSIYNPIVGIQLTNTPTTYRRSFDSYTISDITEPNWTVELYVNNQLVDYMKADASGFYKFEVPLVYGNTEVKLKFYGPWGEERVKEENIAIPFNFLPPKELEYTVSAGIVEDTLSSKFSRANVNYGVNRRLTIGGGVEYLSSLETGSTLPYLSASYRILSGLLLTSEYTYGVRSKSYLSYRLPSNVQMELNYTKYDRGQTAINYNYLEERKAVVSFPVRAKNFSAYSRFTVNQIVLPSLKTTTAEMLWSGSLYGVNTNFTTYGMFNSLSSPYYYSNLSLSFRLPRRFTLTPQTQYDYNESSFVTAKAGLEKPVFKNGYLSLSYEQNFKSNTRSFEFGFRYDLSFAQTGFSFRNSSGQNTFVESARGSLLYDHKTHYLGANNRTNVGKGAITLIPFLDENGNGKRDKGEPMTYGLQFRINGGTIVRNDKDSTIRILDLTPYTSYLLELDKNSFDNIAWQMDNLNIKVTIDPNQFKTIEIPVSVMGEVSGTVYMGSRGQGRVLIDFYKSDGTRVARTLSESDGYYSYLGLKPGKYMVRVDEEQLKKINMASSPEFTLVTISHSFDGDYIEGIDFTLSPAVDKIKDSIAVAERDTLNAHELTVVNPTVPAKVGTSDTLQTTTEVKAASLVPSEKASETMNISGSIIDYEGDVLQVGAFTIKGNAVKIRERLEKITGKPVLIVYEDQYQKVRISGYSNRDLARAFSKQLPKLGFPEIYIPVVKPYTSIQYGVYDNEKDALEAQKELHARTGKKITIVMDHGQYKIRIPYFASREEAIKFAAKVGRIEMKRGIMANNVTEVTKPMVKDTVIQVSKPVVPKVVPSETKAVQNSTQPVVSTVARVDTSKVNSVVKLPVVKDVKPVVVTDTISKLVTVIKPSDKPVLGVDHLIEGPSFVQIATFIDRSDALSAQKKINKLMDRLIVVDYENGINKLRIPNVTRMSESDSLISLMSQNGYPDAFLHKMGDKLPLEEVEFDEDKYSAVIQVGAFVKQENAFDAEKTLRHIADNPISVLFEGGFYKVRLSGFPSRVDAIAFLPKLFSKGFSEAYVVRVLKPGGKEDK